MKKEFDKFIIICIAGQSNAVGYDESQVDFDGLYHTNNKNRVIKL